MFLFVNVLQVCFMPFFSRVFFVPFFISISFVNVFQVFFVAVVFCIFLILQVALPLKIKVHILHTRKMLLLMSWNKKVTSLAVKK